MQALHSPNCEESLSWPEFLPRALHVGMPHQAATWEALSLPASRSHAAQISLAYVEHCDCWLTRQTVVDWLGIFLAALPVINPHPLQTKRQE